MTTETKQAFEGHAVIELFGHNTIAGFVTEESIAGVGFIRVDVPFTDDEHPAFTKYFHPSAVYGLSPCNAAVAMTAAMRLRVRPVSPYTVPVERQLVDSRANEWEEGRRLADAQVEDGDDWSDDEGSDPREHF